jgi:hypothetical protein
VTLHPLLRRTVAGVALTAAAVAGTAFAASAASAAPPGSASGAPAGATSTAPQRSAKMPATANASLVATTPPQPEPGGAGATATPTSTLVAEVAAWVAKGGDKELTTLGTDFGALGKAANAADMTTMGAGCDQLRKDVESAQAYAPIPDASAQREWAAALAAYARGAADCVDGAGAANVELITQAANEIMAGSAHLDKVTARLNDIAGQ